MQDLRVHSTIKYFCRPRDTLLAFHDYMKPRNRSYALHQCLFRTFLLLQPNPNSATQKKRPYPYSRSKYLQISNHALQFSIFRPTQSFIVLYRPPFLCRQAQRWQLIDVSSPFYWKSYWDYLNHPSFTHSACKSKLPPYFDLWDHGHLLLWNVQFL